MRIRCATPCATSHGCALTARTRSRADRTRYRPLRQSAATKEGDGKRVERWLPVVGQEGCYEVSDLGNVRSLDRVGVRNPDRWGRVTEFRIRGRILKASLEQRSPPNGPTYRVVHIRPGSGSVHIAILMLEAFVGPRPPGELARHLNDDSLDDRLENLAWGTHADNRRDAWRNGRWRNRRARQSAEQEKEGGGGT